LIAPSLFSENFVLLLQGRQRLAPMNFWKTLMGLARDLQSMMWKM
jgi:hypothetical protein